ncbi:MAG TPA: DUF502 domain-containing protein [Thermoanaerobaculia bacterium]|jgi:uncharacterized membrane protein
MNFLIKNFLRGLVIVVPVAATIYLLYQSFIAIDRLVGLPQRGLGALVLLVGITVVGILASNFVGRSLIGLMERIFNRAPIVRLVYSSIRDLLEAFVGNKRRFDRPVTFPMGPGVKAIGFITRDDLDFLGLPGDVAVYVPFSYTWDGCMMLVARENLTPITADSASVMALVVSGGVSRAGASD